MDDVCCLAWPPTGPNPKASRWWAVSTTEPLAIMLPKADPDFKKLVDDEMRRLITSREINPSTTNGLRKPYRRTTRR